MGLYVFPLLKPGDYTITVEKLGFSTSTTKVQVLLGQNQSVDIKLELGNSTTTVEVSAENTLLHTEDANITSNVSTRDVEKVPNPGGDITYVAQLQPGAQMNTSSGDGFGNFSAFGLPGTSNLFTINGNDYNDPYLNLNNSGSSNLHSAATRWKRSPSSATVTPGSTGARPVRKLITARGPARTPTTETRRTTGLAER